MTRPLRFVALPKQPDPSWWVGKDRRALTDEAVRRRSEMAASPEANKARPIVVDDDMHGRRSRGPR